MRSTTHNRWFLFIVVTLLGLGLDLSTKYLVVSTLDYGQPVNLIGRYLQLVLVYNTGALWGINPRIWFPDFPVNIFFYIFTTVASVFLIVYYSRIPAGKRLLGWGVALVMPGALGNLWDRLVHPSRGVVDFIRMGIADNMYWPIYNVADIFITVGVIMILIDFILEELHNLRNRSSKSAPDQPDGESRQEESPSTGSADTPVS